jgi:hypothetical protein
MHSPHVQNLSMNLNICERKVLFHCLKTKSFADNEDDYIYCSIFVPFLLSLKKGQL